MSQPGELEDGRGFSEYWIENNRREIQKAYLK